MMKAIIVHQYGDTRQLNLSTIPIPSIGEDEILIKLKYAGINFVDIYERKGIYSTDLPFVPGKEGVGTIVDKGSNVQDFSLGDRIGFAYVDRGAYAQYIAISQHQAVKIPPEIDDATASAILLQGLTAHFLTHDTFPLSPNHVVLVHAGAGGVGALIIQFAKLRGATVIATVSSDEKAQYVRKLGADLALRYDQIDFADSVMDWTHCSGVDAIYDSVGASTWDRNLRALKNRGMLVLYGQSSGAMPTIDLNQQLGRRAEERGSFYVTRPVIRHYVTEPNALTDRAKNLFQSLSNEEIKVSIGGVYPLEEANLAHDLLESRQLIGKLLLRMS